MKRILYLLLTVLFIISVYQGCKGSDELDARGTWEITITGLNGNIADTYTLTGSRISGTVSGGYSQWGVGSYELSGSNISFTYDSNLAGGFYFKFSGRFEGQDKMKGSGIASQALGPDYPSERDFQWSAKRQ